MPSLSTAKTGLDRNSQIDEKKVGLWQYILMTSTVVNVNDVVEENWTMIVLGDAGSGKTTLVSKLRNVEAKDLDVALALDYTYLELIDYEDETHLLGLVDVWQLSGIEGHSPLLKICNEADALDDTIFVITVDLSEPWKIMESLERWASVIRNHLATLEYKEGQKTKLRQLSAQFFRSYKDPVRKQRSASEAAGLGGIAEEDGEGEGEAAAEAKEGKAEAEEGGENKSDGSSQELPPLPDGALEENLGVTIMVVATKSDAMPENLTDPHFDYIQESLRKWCLKHGAGLCYTSSKEDVNIELLWDYLKHILYFKFPLENGPEFMEKDRIFIPIGWDDLGKIEALADSSSGLLRKLPTDEDGNVAYEDVIVKPVFKSPADDGKDLVALDDQAFLSEFKEAITTNDRNPSGDRGSRRSAALNDILKSSHKRTGSNAGVQRARKA